MFLRNNWYVAAWTHEVTELGMVARRILDMPVVIFRDGTGVVSALHDQCCHRALPLSMGAVETDGIRCGYHGMKYAGTGICIEVPSQKLIPKKACVRSWPTVEKHGLIWIWMGEQSPAVSPPDYAWHGDWTWRGGLFYYEANHELINDNLLDLSHLGYVHRHTIGGDPDSHMNAEMRTARTADGVRVERFMRAVTPPPTHVKVNGYVDSVDRWQRVDFIPGLITIYSGSVPAGTMRMEGEQSGGFQQRVFNAITPETEHSSHYFWSVSHETKEDQAPIIDKLYDDTVLTFEEDRVVVNAQYKRMLECVNPQWVDLGIDAGSIQARRRILAGIEREKDVVAER